jgi:hypothetical protein
VPGLVVDDAHMDVEDDDFDYGDVPGLIEEN